METSVHESSANLGSLNTVTGQWFLDEFVSSSKLAAAQVMNCDVISCFHDVILLYNGQWCSEYFSLSLLQFILSCQMVFSFTSRLRKFHHEPTFWMDVLAFYGKNL